MAAEPVARHQEAASSRDGGADGTVRGWSEAAGAAPVPPPTEVPPPEIEGYEILGLLGQGGMGVVYKARQAAANRVVALKMILGGFADGEARERFRTEAHAVARLQHPNVVQVFQVGEYRGLPFFSLEFCAGGSLEARLKAAPTTPAEAARLIDVLARAVHHAHERGIVHRDLKPANVLLTEDGTPKLTDFGLAKKLDEVGRTQTGAVMGSPPYMAPEQASGRVKEIGPLTDVYGLGAILYECLTGRPPFKADTLVETLIQVQQDEPAAPRRLRAGTPRDLETICLKCLQKDPKRRYSSAAALADDLRRHLAGEPITARPVGRLERAWRWGRRRAALLGIAAAAVAATAVALLLPRTPAPAPQKPVPSDAVVRQSAAEMHRALFAAVAPTRGPDGWFQNSLRADFPRTAGACWSHAQALSGLLADPDAGDEDLRALLPSIALPFTPGQRVEADGFRYGWRPDLGAAYTQAEPALWTATYLAIALRRPGLLRGDDRRRAEEWFADTQAILRNYRPADFSGGWNMYARQREPEQASVYATTLALLALLEARESGLAWDGDARARDELLRKTTAWLVAHWVADSDPPGWRTTFEDPVDFISDGLTIQIYAELLRAEADAGVALPAVLSAEMPRHLKRCLDRSLDYPLTTMNFSFDFTTFEDKPVVNQTHPVKLNWYPWAIDCAARRLRGAERSGASPEEVADLRRVLGHLMVELKEEALTRLHTGQTFQASETLFGLSAIPPPDAAYANGVTR